MSNENRIRGLEQALEAKLPLDYREFLASHNEDPDRHQQVVSSNPDYWGVRNIFELGDGEGILQLEENHRLVGDVLPSGMLAVADDSAGNLYLLDTRPGRGEVYWWDHERDHGDDRIDKVADTFGDFLRLLIPSPD